MKSRTILLTLILPVYIVSCGRAPSSSSSNADLKDIVTPGDIGDSNTLFWVDADQVARGECIVGSAPTRENCQKNLVKASMIETTKRATEAYASRASGIQAMIATEINSLKSADPTVKELTSVVNALTVQKTELEKAVTSEESLVSAKAAQKAGLEKNLAYVDAQLVEIEKALAATPNDQMLQKLKLERQDEKRELTTSISILTDDIVRLTASFQWHKSELEACKKSLTDTSAKLKAVFDALNVTSAKLDSLKVQEKFAKDSSGELNGVVSYLKLANITFKGNLFTAERQDALKTFSDSIVPPVMIKDGRYKAISGHTSYCPQRLQAKSLNGVLQSLTTTYLSPCGGASDSFKCTGKVCKGTDATVTVLSQTQYEFVGNYKAIFEYQSSSLDADATPNGPHDSL